MSSNQNVRKIQSSFPKQMILSTLASPSVSNSQDSGEKTRGVSSVHSRNWHGNHLTRDILEKIPETLTNEEMIIMQRDRGTTLVQVNLMIITAVHIAAKRCISPFDIKLLHHLQLVFNASLLLSLVTSHLPSWWQGPPTSTLKSSLR